MFSRENLGPWPSLVWVEAVKAESGSVSWTPSGTVQPTCGGVKPVRHKFGFKRANFSEHCYENNAATCMKYKCKTCFMFCKAEPHTCQHLEIRNQDIFTNLAERALKSRAASARVFSSGV